MARRRANRKSSSGPPPSPSAIERKDGCTATTISELPADIISDILLRLHDIKSIIRCREVCKTWCDLLFRPDFTKLQLSRGSLPLSLILHHHDVGPTRRYPFGILELNDPVSLCRRRNATLKSKSEFYIPQESGRSVRIRGECNGLICLYVNDDEIVVCNPIFQGRRRYILPKPIKLTATEQTVGIGFGYSSLNDKYKVLRCVKRSSVEFEICTLGSDDTWRNIGRYKELPSPDTSFYDKDYVFVKGALYWICGDMGSKLICCFDVENEKFQNLPLPCRIEYGDTFNLGAVDNCLCLSILLSNYHVDVWVMKDYQDARPWTLKWTFGLYINFFCIDGLKWPIKPIKVFEDGSILVIFQNRTIGYYNRRKGVLEAFKYHGVRLWSAAMAYTPSFVSPPWIQ